MILTEPVPHAEAAAFLRGKPAVLRSLYDRLLPEIKGRAFTISGIAQLDILRDARDAMATLPEGGDWDEIKRRLVDILEPDLGAGAERRAELLLRLHGYQAYAAANHRVLEEMADTYPYRQYMSAQDSRVRHSHAALNGLVLPADSPFWRRHTPPWEWGCRCDVRGITAEEYNDIRADDAGRKPAHRLILDDATRARMETAGVLDRGDGTPYDLRTPVERGQEGGFEWEPGSFRLDPAALRARYEATGDGDLWSAFEAMARATILDVRRTVWDWLHA